VAFALAAHLGLLDRAVATFGATAVLVLLLLAVPTLLAATVLALLAVLATLLMPTGLALLTPLAALMLAVLTSLTLLATSALLATPTLLAALALLAGLMLALLTHLAVLTALAHLLAVTVLATLTASRRALVATPATATLALLATLFVAGVLAAATAVLAHTVDVAVVVALLAAALILADLVALARLLVATLLALLAPLVGLVLASFLMAALLLDIAAAHLVLAGLVLALLTVATLLTHLAVLALLAVLTLLMPTGLALLAPLTVLATTMLAVLALLTHLFVLAHLAALTLLASLVPLLAHLFVLARPSSSVSATRGVSSLRLSFALRTALVATVLLLVAPPTVAIISCHNQVPRWIFSCIFLMCTGRSLTRKPAESRTRPVRSEVSTLKAGHRHVSHMEPRDLSSHTVYQAGRGIEEVARDLGLDPDDLVKLASNENPFGPSPAAVEAIREAAGSANSYPKASHADLTEKLADRWSVAPEQVWLANGGDGVLDYLARAMLEPGEAVLVPDPGFAYYGMSARYHHGEVQEYQISKADDFALAAETVLDDYEGRESGDSRPRRTSGKSDGGERIVYLTSPHNPTGKRFDLDAVAEIADRTGGETLVVVDEAYGEFADGPSAVELVGERDDVAVLRTFSKVYGLAGVRLGYAIVPEAWADAYTRVSTPFAASEIACRAGLAALDDDDHARKTVETAEWAREYLYENLDAPTWESHGNFVLAEVGDASEVADELQRRGVIVRDCTSFGLPECVRITCGTEAETKRAVAELNEVLAS
jgi:histidinol-phosphate aminotransferase